MNHSVKPTTPSRSSEDVEQHASRSHLQARPSADLVSTPTTPGLRKIVAFKDYSGKATIYAVIVLLALLIFIMSIDAYTTPRLIVTAYVYSDNRRIIRILTGIYVASSVILVIVPVFYARIADRVGRAEAFGVALVLYFIGFILMGSAKKSDQVSAGYIFRYLGYAGLAVLPSILVADITSMRLRGLALSLISVLSLISTFIYLPLLNGLLNNASWTMGFYIYAIIIPFLILPIIALIVLGQRRRKTHVASTGMRGHLVALDIVGILILTASVSFLVVAFYLASNTSTALASKNSWKSPTVIVLVILGLLLLPVFYLYETRWTNAPFASRHVLGSRAVLVVFAIILVQGLASGLASNWTFQTLYLNGGSANNDTQAYVLDAQKITSYGAAVIAGLVLFLTRRLKWLLVASLVIQLVGYGVSCRSGGSSLSEYLASQILLGFGSGFSHLTTLVLVQISVPHVDLATATALYGVVVELGRWVGNVVGMDVWYHRTFALVSSQLPDLPSEDVLSFITGWSQFGFIGRYPGSSDDDTDMLRSLIASAFGTVAKRLSIVSTVLMVVPLVVAVVAVREVNLGGRGRERGGENLVEGEDEMRK